MKIVKINSMTCTSCIIMNNIINEIKDKYNIEVDSLDYDFDDVDDYNVGNILPVIIFYKDNTEYKRLVGEHSKKEVEDVVLEVQNEEN